MGLASWILGIGISIEQTVQQVGVRSGKVPLQWPVGPRGVIHRLPRDPHQRASIFAEVQTLIVSEGELAVVLEDGKAGGVLEPGRYVFAKARVVGSLDVVWVSTAQQTLKWGVGNILSSDGIQVGANGMLYIRVVDALAFNSEVVQGAVALGEVDLQRYLLPRVQGVLRSTIARWPALELQTLRDAFPDAVRAALAQTVGKLGLAIVDLEVVDLSLPAEFKSVVAGAAMAQQAGRTALVEAQTRAQVAQLDAVAEAQAKLTSGMADVQLMAQLQAQGIDPLKMKALEALQTYAATPSAPSIVPGADVAKAQLMGAVMSAALMPPGTPVATAPQLLPSLAPAPAPAPAPLPAARETIDAKPAGDGLADLERQIDALTERLAEGKISEETYQKLSARLEGKIAALRGQG
jgi:regulator of protease activity HflC (stomatin/prohibitin superfamily)